MKRPITTNIPSRRGYVGCVKRTISGRINRPWSCVSRPLRNSHDSRGRTTSPKTDKSDRHAFTLLEVMLSLILVSFVLTIVAMAIDIHLRVLDAGRAKIEEGQLARAILQRIADDLRNAVVYRPPDVTEQLADAVAGSGGNLDDGLVAEFESFASSIGADLGAVGSIPGLYGEADWLQIDVMRLPRLDEYNYHTAETNLSSNADVLSAVKTVLYFLEVPEQTGALAADGSARYDGGLIRREMDRSATLWAEQQGMLSEMNRDLEPLAVEISNISFEYYDGTEFLDYWDTEEKSGLPKAVLISIAVTPVDDEGGEFATLWSSVGSDLEADSHTAVYRLLVTLPISEPFETDDESAEETSSEEMTSE